MLLHEPLPSYLADFILQHILLFLFLLYADLKCIIIVCRFKSNNNLIKSLLAKNSS